MVLLVLSVTLTLLLLPLYKNFLLAFNGVRENYLRERVPLSFGGLIFFIESVFLILFGGEGVVAIWLGFLIITVIGTYDDFYGITSIKGLRGHLRAFFQGKVTSGFLKALSGGVVALLISWSIGGGLGEKAAHFLLILLMINMLNLFDLRPGRAIKVFLIFFAILALTTPFWSSSLAPVLLGIMLVVYVDDISAKIMLGDSGANLLGLHLGVWYSLFLPIFWQWAAVAFLLLLHIYTENYSLTLAIEKNWLLKKIDLLGRRGT